MSEELVGRLELEKLGDRVSALEMSCVKCRTEKSSDIDHLKEEVKEMKRDVLDIKNNIQILKEQVSGLTIKLSISVAIVVTIVNLIAPFVFKKIGL